MLLLSMILRLILQVSPLELIPVLHRQLRRLTDVVEYLNRSVGLVHIYWYWAPPSVAHAPFRLFQTLDQAKASTKVSSSDCPTDRTLEALAPALFAQSEYCCGEGDALSRVLRRACQGSPHRTLVMGSPLFDLCALSSLDSLTIGRLCPPEWPEVRIASVGNGSTSIRQHLQSLFQLTPDRLAGVALLQCENLGQTFMDLPGSQGDSNISVGQYLQQMRSGVYRRGIESVLADAGASDSILSQARKALADVSMCLTGRAGEHPSYSSPLLAMLSAQARIPISPFFDITWGTPLLVGDLLAPILTRLALQAGTPPPSLAGGIGTDTQVPRWVSQPGSASKVATLLWVSGLSSSPIPPHTHSAVDTLTCMVGAWGVVALLCVGRALVQRRVLSVGEVEAALTAAVAYADLSNAEREAYHAKLPHLNSKLPSRLMCTTALVAEVERALLASAAVGTQSMAVHDRSVCDRRSVVSAVVALGTLTKTGQIEKGDDPLHCTMDYLGLSTSDNTLTAVRYLVDTYVTNAPSETAAVERVIPEHDVSQMVPGEQACPLYPELSPLPADSKWDSILETILCSDADTPVFIAGETGSGKSTRVPAMIRQ
ncbi:hypothetical protein KIPB_006129, partial [Kipferlia bialata]|eukprot:g6129.t1